MVLNGTPLSGSLLVGGVDVSFEDKPKPPPQPQPDTIWTLSGHLGTSSVPHTASLKMGTTQYLPGYFGDWRSYHSGPAVVLAATVAVATTPLYRDYAALLKSGNSIKMAMGPIDALKNKTFDQLAAMAPTSGNGLTEPILLNVKNADREVD